jgi:hypothetical protein
LYGIFCIQNSPVDPDPEFSPADLDIDPDATLIIDTSMKNSKSI